MLNQNNNNNAINIQYVQLGGLWLVKLRFNGVEVYRDESRNKDYLDHWVDRIMRYQHVFVK